MEPRLTIVTLGVSDLERAVRFYRDGLGLPVRDTFPDAVFFQMGSVRLGLYPRHLLARDANVAEAGSGFAGITLAHNVRTREAVQRILDEAVGAGGTVVQPPRVADWGGYSAYFSDPDGYLWEVACTPDGSLD